MNDVKFDPSRTLEETSVQELQLELIRRSRFNDFDGKRVVRTLLVHRDLWEAVILDRFGVPMAGRLPVSGLIKLRDLPFNLWNADTLYVLCPHKKSAKRLAAIAEKDAWGGETAIFSDQRTVDDALGSGRDTRAILRVWWD
jgi:hypothetical protein